MGNSKAIPEIRVYSAKSVTILPIAEMIRLMENQKVPQMSPEAIKWRSRRIRLNASELARRANRGVTTAYIMLAGRGVHPHTSAAIVAALVAEELALQAHLNSLHPLEATKEAAE